jgi:hypothetical protein
MNKKNGENGDDQEGADQFDLNFELSPDFGASRFDGSDYEPEFDDSRLRGQLARIYQLMKDGAWRTLSEIEEGTGDPQPSISAQLRHLRKKRFGSHKVNRRSRGEREHGLFEYQLEP